MPRRVLLVSALLLAACGGAEKPRAPATATARPAGATPTVAIAAADHAACASLYARLQRVSLALSSGSELITRAADKADLSRRIATQQQQLERSADLMDGAVVPAPLAAANRSLVKALRAFAGDFERARRPARRGDFPAAVQEMSDQAAVSRIITAATKIQEACKPQRSR